MHTFSMKLEYTLSYSSPEAFIYVVSTHSVHVEYEDPSMIAWWTLQLSEDSSILV